MSDRVFYSDPLDTVIVGLPQLVGDEDAKKFL